MIYVRNLSNEKTIHGLYPGECGCVNDADAPHPELEVLRQAPPPNAKRPRGPGRPRKEASQNPEPRQDSGNDKGAPSLAVAGEDKPAL